MFVGVLAALVVHVANDPAAAARQEIEREASALWGGDSASFAQRHPRVWTNLSWIYRGSGAVGRLHDLCTGAVEPAPVLAVGATDWEALDPRQLSPEDRDKILLWRAHVGAAAYGCGTVFEIAGLAEQAKSKFRQCPDVAGAEAFVVYVNRQPRARTSDDLLKTTVSALRTAGCR